MAFMRADCKYPFGCDAATQAAKRVYIKRINYVIYGQRPLYLAAETPAPTPRNWAASFLKSIGSASRSPGVWAHLSSGQAEISANFIRIGVAIASPNAIASRSAIEDRKAIVLLADTPAAARMIPLSSSLASRIAKRVEHWDNTVGSSSDGRWVTTPSEAPYFRPSLLSVRSPAWPDQRFACCRRKYSDGLLRTTH